MTDERNDSGPTTKIERNDLAPKPLVKELGEYLLGPSGAVFRSGWLAPEIAWAANPQVALGYLFFAVVCLLYSLLPAAKEPVTVDESDIVAGH